MIFILELFSAVLNFFLVDRALCKIREKKMTTLQYRVPSTTPSLQQQRQLTPRTYGDGKNEFLQPQNYYCQSPYEADASAVVATIAATTTEQQSLSSSSLSPSPFTSSMSSKRNLSPSSLIATMTTIEADAISKSITKTLTTF